MALRPLNLELMPQKKGWGAYLEGDTNQGLWSVSESQLHISELEIKAVHFAVLTLAFAFVVAALFFILNAWFIINFVIYI